MKINLSFVVLIFIALSGLAYGQNGSISGTVSYQGNQLITASVVLMNTQLGARTDKKGFFEIKNVPAGKYKIKVTYIGYKENIKEIEVVSGKAASIEFEMEEAMISSNAISVIASRAEFRDTPVAFSNIVKQDLEMNLASRDIPMVLNETPGVYATESGGGYGDSRINLRGFDQRNITVMINGVPINDMENGWVYWSNWDGLSDVTSSIQVQRGLGAGKVASPSVGGTLNILTDAAEQKAGVRFKQEYGSGDYLKSAIIANSGLNNGLAFTLMATRKTANGVIDKTWVDAWSYFFALSWDISDKHKIDVYLNGAPQSHGQRSFRKSIQTYDSELANSAGVPDSIIYKTVVKDRGFLFNEHWGADTFATKSYYYGSVQDNHGNDYLNERENYFHKPQMNVNWLWNIVPKMSLTNVFYISIGNGGGSSRVGPTLSFTEDNQIDFNKQILFQQSELAIDSNFDYQSHRATSALRNSVNNHFWTGWLGTWDYKPTEELRLQAGIDLRYYVGEHYQEVRNLLGGEYFVETIGRGTAGFVDSTSDLNIVGNRDLWVKGLGDKIGYYYEGYVNWTGGFAQVEYKENDLSTYLNLSFSNTGYKRKDYFRTSDSPNGIETDWQSFLGFTAKTGANYNINEELNVYANAGYYSRAPLYTAVFSNDNAIYGNTNNEKVISFEAGSGYWEKYFTANFNVYYTNWKDRSWTRSLRDSNDNLVYYNLTGINALHQGAELEMSYRANRFLRFKGMLSLGDWIYTDNVAAYSYDEANKPRDSVFLYLKDLKVGNSAQKSMSLSANISPIKRMYFNIVYKYYWDNYADFSPTSRTFANDKAQSWMLPNYGIFDVHFGYTFVFESYFDLKLRANIMNLFDLNYIADAEDNRAIIKNPITKLPLHNAQAAEVWFGLPRRFILSVEFVY